MADDPRREPDDSGLATGVRRKAVLSNLESLAPTPSQPPRDQPGAVLDYMLALANMHRSDAAYAAARAEEAAQELKVEVDHLKAHLLKLGGKVERLEDRVGLIVNTQITQNSEISSVKTSLIGMQSVFEGAITNLHARVGLVESGQKQDRLRMDGFEKSFAQFRELILADVSVRRRQIELEEIKNGGPTSTRPPDTPSDTEGSEGI